MNRLGQSIYILTWFEKLFCPGMIDVPIDTYGQMADVNEYRTSCGVPCLHIKIAELGARKFGPPAARRLELRITYGRQITARSAKMLSYASNTLRCRIVTIAPRSP